MKSQSKKQKKKQRKYIFVMGGVMSGIGKGVTTASMGTALQAKGFKVTLMKADPYLNVDAGTMNPTEHGEVFVLGSGLETDQDMGNYERFLNTNLPSENYMTNGMIFKHVIDKERALGYKGKCVEPTFHITEEIMRRIDVACDKTDADIFIMEIGGTVGEYQNAIFLEAARQLRLKNKESVMYVMVTYLPTPAKLGEMKTKPTQNAVRQLNSYGVNPHIIIARSEVPIDKKRKEKIANMCSVDHVVAAPDVDSIYEVPLNFEKDGLSDYILKEFDLKPRAQNIGPWRSFVKKMKQPEDQVKIAIAGKYFDTGDFMLSDAYLSVIEALKISAFHQKKEPLLEWINVKDFETGKRKLSDLDQYDGVLIPGGFGETGIEGKIKAIEYVRKNKIPYFGICYGMQLMVIEYGRNVVKFKDAHTTEINKKTPYPLIDIMEDQKVKLKEKHYGGSMRLGNYPAMLQRGTIARRAYKADEIVERHRHRYEVNPKFIDDIQSAGLVFSGKSPNGQLMEIAELPEKVHPFFVGAQFHPEFLARPLSPHPLFSAFIKAASEKGKKKGK